MNQSDVVTYYGKVRLAAVRAGDNKASGLSHYQIHASYINNTRKIIRAKLRSNLEITIPAVAVRMPYSNDETFIVKKELIVGASCVEHMLHYFTSLPDAYGELEMFRKAYLQVYENVYRFGQSRELRCVIEYTFTEQDLAGHGDIFYHDELDTLFKFGDEPFDLAHPHSPQGRQESLEQAAEAIRDEKGFVFWIEIIDNLQKYGERFFSICNQVYKVTPRPDKNRPDGLYIVSSRPTNGRINSTEIQSRTYSLDNIEKELGIYSTYELAQTHGDVAGQRKREMMDKEHLFAQQKQEWAAEKLKLEREAEDRNRLLREAEAERAAAQQQMKDLRMHQEHLAEIQRIQMKEKFEERSAERKDASEFIKFLPSILAAIGTIFMAWRASKSS